MKELGSLRWSRSMGTIRFGKGQWEGVSSKEIAQWKSDLRRMTKIYRSIGEDDVTAFREARNLFSNFRESWDDLIQRAMPPRYSPYWGIPNAQANLEALNRAASSVLPSSLFPTAYDYHTGGHKPAPWELKKKRPGLIRKYQKAFRVAFEALENYEEMSEKYSPETGGIVPEKKFEVAGLKIVVDSHRDTPDWKDLESRIPHLSQVVKKVERAGFGKAVRGMTVFIRPHKDAGGTYTAATDSVTINPTWGFGPRADTAEYTLIHEIGHRFYYRELSSHSREMWKDTIDALSLQGDYELTEYGKEDEKEAYAEAFANYIARGPRSMGPGILDLFQRVSLAGGAKMARERSLVASYLSRIAGGQLFHTTSVDNLLSILRSGKLIPQPSGVGDEAFVSFSEVPYTGDISHNDVVMAFRPGSSVHGQVMKVDYTESWYKKYPEHASYIAGSGWYEMYEPPEWLYEPPEDLDEDELDWWEPEDEDVEAAMQEAEMDSFLFKSDEKEWVSKKPFADVKFSPKDLLGVLVVQARNVPHVEETLQKAGYGHVRVRTLADGVKSLMKAASKGNPVVIRRQARELAETYVVKTAAVRIPKDIVDRVVDNFAVYASENLWDTRVEDLMSDGWVALASDKDLVEGILYDLVDDFYVLSERDKASLFDAVLKMAEKKWWVPLSLIKNPFRGKPLALRTMKNKGLLGKVKALYEEMDREIRESLEKYRDTLLLTPEYVETIADSSGIIEEVSDFHFESALREAGLDLGDYEVEKALIDAVYKEIRSRKRF
jgi:hypothetical protein